MVFIIYLKNYVMMGLQDLVLLWKFEEMSSRKEYYHLSKPDWRNIEFGCE